MAGYSGTPLIQKIGIKPGHRIILRNHPASFVKTWASFLKEQRARTGFPAVPTLLFISLTGWRSCRRFCHALRLVGSRWHAVDRLA